MVDVYSTAYAQAVVFRDGSGVISVGRGEQAPFGLCVPSQTGMAVKRWSTFEVHEDMFSAIAREKQLKGGSRRKKLSIIDRFNKGA
jgi:hypothetical protein